MSKKPNTVRRIWLTKHRLSGGKLPDIAAMLERIYQDSEKHPKEIRGMLLRSDPQSIPPA
jgi:hypothetical protein